MGIDTHIALPRSLHDYIECRADVVRLLSEADSMLRTADAAMKRFYPYGLGRASTCYEDLPRQIAEVDRKLWRQAYDKTGLHALMDAEARRKFDDALERNPLPFTLDNIKAEFFAFRQTSDAMFARGVYNVFLRLARSGYRTNDREPFEIGAKCILTYMISPRFAGGLEVAYRAADQLNDIDRVIKILDGQTYVPRSLESAINGALTERPYIFEDEYYRAKAFKNGNLHLEIKRADLLERVNQIIGEYCNGNALAAA